MKRLTFWLCVVIATCACSAAPTTDRAASSAAAPAAAYFDNAGRDDALSGGVKMIPITTPKGTFKVWTKRVGSDPTIKVLLLHGGPGATHEYMEAFDSYFPAAGVEYYYYDQLGSYYSDQPDQPELWDLPRFVDEVEQVRTVLRLTNGNPRRAASCSARTAAIWRCTTTRRPTWTA
jgi:proline iminopeptidase